MIGKRISQYRILEKLGGGGMGEVYAAEDTKLQRKLALKFLPAGLAKDDQALERFQREARAASALNHPHICTIYDIDSGALIDPDGNVEAEAVHYIAMELMQGTTLKRVIQDGPLDLEEFVEFALQIADALDAAHSQGIIHRDIKPENIFVTKRRQIKILDFGLAKLSDQEFTAEQLHDMKTKTPGDNLTTPGSVIGTVAYMSPEAARGHQVDARSDLFSFGVVLYEMATGKAAFAAKTTALTFEAILNRYPDPPSRVNPQLPAGIEAMIGRMLEKDPDLRYQSASDIRSELKRVRRDFHSGKLSESGGRDSAMPGSGRESVGGLSGAPSWGAPQKGADSVPVSQRQTTHRRWPAASAGLLLLAALVISFVLFKGRRPSQHLEGTYSQITDAAGMEAQPSLSPDGTFVVYTGRSPGNYDIFLLRVGGKNAINLTADSPVHDVQPSLSPDGQFIAFRSDRQDGGIFVMGATGESVRRITESGSYPSWSPDGKEIVFCSESFLVPDARLIDSKLWIVDVASGKKRLLSTPDDAIQPTWSPAGKRIAYWGIVGRSGNREIWTVGADGSGAKMVTNHPATDWNPVWSPDGEFLYFSSNRGGSMNLWRVPIDEVTGETEGDPEPLTTPSQWSGYLSFSRGGQQMAYAAMDMRANVQKIAFDPDTEKAERLSEPVTSTTLTATEVTSSPDGKSLVFRTYGKREDLTICDADGQNIRRITDDLYRNRGPVWSPSGDRIAFYSDRSGAYEIWSIRPDGSGLQQLTKSQGRLIMPHFMPDGVRLFASDFVGAQFIDLTESMPTTNFSAPLPPIQEGLAFFPHSASPDGKFLAGGPIDIESGPLRGIYIYSLESNKYQKLLDIGLTESSIARWFGSPQWLGDGKRLLFIDGNRLHTVHRDTLQTRTIWEPPGNAEILWFHLTNDNRNIYVSLLSFESNLWMIK